MKIIKKTSALAGVCLALAGCGVSNNVTFTTNAGQCPGNVGNGTSPYCMAVVLQNNSGSSGGQNFINSTNFPISQLSFVISGVSNILNPATNPSGSSNSMDPNNCAGSTIQPGGTCTFYIKINAEAFPVQSQESVSITVNYTINNTLFGGSTNTASANTTIYELTNLYAAQNNGNLTIYNNAWSNYGLVESSDTVNSMAIDTYYGLVYLGGNNGIYQYSPSNNVTSGSVSSGITGTNNLFTISTNLYAAGLSQSTSGIWSYSLQGESWNSTSAAYTLNNIVTTANANATGSSAIYVAGNGSSQVYACTTTSGSGNCNTEGSSGIPSAITALGFLTVTSPPITGLYVGTESGIYAESAPTTPTSVAIWGQVPGESNPITTMAILAGGSTLYAGDNQGNIWQIAASNPQTQTLFATVPSTSSISALAIDQFANVVYAVAGGSIYSCSNSTCTSVLTLINPYAGSNAVVSAGIGSMLTNTLTTDGNLQ